LAGDEALTHIAAVLRDTTRDVDCAARYGGEEFVVIMPETKASGAIEMAQRIRTLLAADERVGGKLSISIGVAQFPEDGDAPDALLARADAALYRAKREGRDRVLRAPPAPPPPPASAQPPPGPIPPRATKLQSIPPAPPPSFPARPHPPRQA